MEDTLREAFLQDLRQELDVLILVLMEDTLRVERNLCLLFSFHQS